MVEKKKSYIPSWERENQKIKVGDKYPDGSGRIYPAHRLIPKLNMFDGKIDEYVCDRCGSVQFLDKKRYLERDACYPIFWEDFNKPWKEIFRKYREMDDHAMLVKKKTVD
jgi:hypothetical protein